MQYSIEEGIKNSFKLGYITAILENELHDDWENDLTTNDISHNGEKYLNTLLLFHTDYQSIFKEELILLPRFKNKNDLTEFLFATFELIKDKITSLDQPNIELAYFAGGAVAICYSDNLAVFSEEKLAAILTLIFNWCDSSALNQLDSNISKLLSNDFYECMIARNNICEKLLGKNLTSEQRSAFRFLDRVVVNKQ